MGRPGGILHLQPSTFNPPPSRHLCRFAFDLVAEVTKGAIIGNPLLTRVLEMPTFPPLRDTSLPSDDHVAPDEDFACSARMPTATESGRDRRECGQGCQHSRWYESLLSDRPGSNACPAPPWDSIASGLFRARVSERSGAGRSLKVDGRRLMVNAKDNAASTCAWYFALTFNPPPSTSFPTPPQAQSQPCVACHSTLPARRAKGCRSRWRR
jgi:hypothetical protein